jgi:hypothetical protein
MKVTLMVNFSVLIIMHTSDEMPNYLQGGFLLIASFNIPVKY